MNINIQGLHCSIRHTPLAALLYMLVLLGVQPALSGSVHAQAVQPPITYGQTVQGALGSPGDAVLPDGRPIDRYRLVTQAPGQTYVIRAASLQFPVASSIAVSNPATQRTVLLQYAQVSLPGQQVLYGGRLPRPGTYIITVFSPETQRSLGGYTLSLRCLDDDGTDDDLDDLDDDDSCPTGAPSNLTPPTPTPGVDSSGPGSLGDDNPSADDLGLGGDELAGDDDDGFDD